MDRGMKYFTFIISLFAALLGFSAPTGSSYSPASSYVLPDDTTTNSQRRNIAETKTEPDDIENKTPEHFKYAIKLKIQVELVKDLKLFKVLTEWLGTRYVFGGNTKKGIDCSGFTQQVMQEVYNISLHRVVGPQYNQCKPIEKEELRMGDLVFFHTTRAGLSHVGLYIGENKFIHASSTRGVVVDDLTATYYKNAYRKAGRILPD
jgi:lipoprotein Spr